MRYLVSLALMAMLAGCAGQQHDNSPAARLGRAPGAGHNEPPAYSGYLPLGNNQKRICFKPPGQGLCSENWLPGYH